MITSIDLYGKDNMESTKCDIIFETISEVFMEMVKALFEKDETKKVCNEIAVHILSKSHLRLSNAVLLLLMTKSSYFECVVMSSMYLILLFFSIC